MKNCTPKYQPIPELTELSVRSPDGQETYLLSDANIRELSFKQSLMNKGKMVSVSQLSLLYKRAGHLGSRVRRFSSSLYSVRNFRLKFQKKNFGSNFLIGLKIDAEICIWVPLWQETCRTWQLTRLRNAFVCKCVKEWALIAPWSYAGHRYIIQLIFQVSHPWFTFTYPRA